MASGDESDVGGSSTRPNDAESRRPSTTSTQGSTADPEPSQNDRASGFFGSLRTNRSYNPLSKDDQLMGRDWPPEGPRREVRGTAEPLASMNIRAPRRRRSSAPSSAGRSRQDVEAGATVENDRAGTSDSDTPRRPKGPRDGSQGPPAPPSSPASDADGVADSDGYPTQSSRENNRSRFRAAALLPGDGDVTDSDDEDDFDDIHSPVALADFGRETSMGEIDFNQQRLPNTSHRRSSDTQQLFGIESIIPSKADGSTGSSILSIRYDDHQRPNSSFPNKGYDMRGLSSNRNNTEQFDDSNSRSPSQHDNSGSLNSSFESRQQPSTRESQTRTSSSTRASNAHTLAFESRERDRFGSNTFNESRINRAPGRAPTQSFAATRSSGSEEQFGGTGRRASNQQSRPPQLRSQATHQGQDIGASGAAESWDREYPTPPMATPPMPPPPIPTPPRVRAFANFLQQHARVARNIEQASEQGQDEQKSSEQKDAGDGGYPWRLPTQETTLPSPLPGSQAAVRQATRALHNITTSNADLALVIAESDKYRRERERRPLDISVIERALGEAFNEFGRTPNSESPEIRVDPPTPQPRASTYGTGPEWTQGTGQHRKRPSSVAFSPASNLQPLREPAPFRAPLEGSGQTQGLGIFDMPSDASQQTGPSIDRAGRFNSSRGPGNGSRQDSLLANTSERKRHASTQGNRASMTDSIREPESMLRRNAQQRRLSIDTRAAGRAMQSHLSSDDRSSRGSLGRNQDTAPSSRAGSNAHDMPPPPPRGTTGNHGRSTTQAQRQSTTQRRSVPSQEQSSTSEASGGPRQSASAPPRQSSTSTTRAGPHQESILLEDESEEE
ncbi:uncharacterized protein LY89DRAFT_668145 [Mollisia scopiformis]|uniref:Uncharacterized protein n=1 Tax=Mollisia scopiformis TaxID=149040 RepID=A0A194XCN9_MOLSC|nr:uncharacterized protein LY89DRAFT_668145 [Mollisia scopiformis]KUJ17935.1 hypothetical protein LY89DRAFT_668145 [Mollisia scopiformis]